MTLVFTNLPKDVPPIDFTGVVPGAISELTIEAARRTTILCGNRMVQLGELFHIDGDPASLKWKFVGEMDAVHSVGAAMSGGTIDVEGNIGRRLGARMSGGEIRVEGNAGDWLGAEMLGGEIRVAGNAGHFVGSSFRGSRRGMRGGEIMVHGDAGDEVGNRMRRGLIAIAGSAGQWLGKRMLAGTIIATGPCGPRPGAGMRRGTIGLFGGNPPELLPTFRFACRERPAVLAMIGRQLGARGFPLSRSINRDVDMYHGDFLELGRGELLLGGA